MNPLSIFSGPYALIAKWVVIAVLALSCMAFGALKMHAHDAARYEALQTQYDTFKGGVEALGMRAAHDKVVTEAADKLLKKKADDENTRTTAALRADVKRLRDDVNSGRGGMSAPAPSPTSPDRTCFDPAQLAGALRSLDQGLLGIIESGSQAVIDLDTARAWAQEKK